MSTFGAAGSWGAGPRRAEMRSRRRQNLGAGVVAELGLKVDKVDGEVMGNLGVGGALGAGTLVAASDTVVAEGAVVDGELGVQTLVTPHTFQAFSASQLDTTSITGLTGLWKWVGGVLAPNGKIYCAPGGADSVLIIDPATNTTDRTTIAGLGTQGDKWSGGALGRDGNIYFTPRHEGRVLVVDPRTDTASFIEGAGQAGIDEWRTRTSAGDYNWRSICWSPERNLFVATAVFKGGSVSEGGNGGRVMTSPDGARPWTRRNSGIVISNCNNGPGNQITCTSTAGLTVGMTVGIRINPAGGEGEVTDDTSIVSVDSATSFTTNTLITELSNTTLVADNNWISVCWSKEAALFVAVATSGTGNRIMTSPNAVTWTRRTSPADNNWHSVCWSTERNLFVAVSAVSDAEPTKRCMTSSDGINWALQTTPERQWRSVTWAAEIGLFVAVADNGTGDRVMTSPDGVTWTSRASAADNNWFSVVWARELGLLVAVATSGDGNRVMTSRDGITWVSRASAANNAWFSVAWSAELGYFVAVGSSDRVMVSRNGFEWSLRDAPSANWSAIAWSPQQNIFAAVSSSGTGNRVMTSSLDRNKWMGGVQAPDGKIYCIPRHAERVLVIDPSTRGLSFIELDAGLNPSATDKWVLGALGPNGKVYGVPSSSSQVLVIDPVAGTATDGGMTAAPGSSIAVTTFGKWEGGVLGQDGRIYCVPFDASTTTNINDSQSILIIDPRTNTYDTTTISGLTTAVTKMIGGVLAPDGKIYMVPWDRFRVVVIDTTVSPPTVELEAPELVVPAQTPVSGKWAGGVLAPNGKIYTVPTQATNVLIIRPGLPRFPAWMIEASFNKL